MCVLAAKSTTNRMHAAAIRRALAAGKKIRGEIDTCQSRSTIDIDLICVGQGKVDK